MLAAQLANELKADLSSLLYYTISCWMFLEIIALLLNEEARTRFRMVANGLLAIIAVTILGGITGYIGGMSRVGVVGQIMPAALGLLGAISIYIFGVKNAPNPVTFILVIGFSGSLFVGYVKGADVRSHDDSWSGYLESCKTLFFDPDVLKDEKTRVAVVEMHGKRCMHLLNGEFNEATSFNSP